MNTTHGRRSETDRISAAAERLTERDRTICELLYEHRVLTSLQLRELHFSGDHRARQRLVDLYRLGVLDRFRPHRQTGSAPYHYLLGKLGAEIVAAERGLAPNELDWQRDSKLKLASSSQLTHLVGANGFFTRLIAALHERPDLELLEWWGQRRCGNAWGELVRPDGYCALALPDGDVLELCLEWDRSTEPHHRIDDKVARYRELEAALDRDLTIAIVAPTDRREQELNRHLGNHSAHGVVLTTADRHAADPLARNWLQPAATTRRALTELDNDSRPDERR
ncbi:MAG: replication-relaxation family protein [Chloroflexota bacterium]